ncbi:Zinc transporter ZIP2 [Manis javanica]|nr:Zinc transporter ZIP2 [Manis javanica]
MQGNAGRGHTEQEDPNSLLKQPKDGATTRTTSGRHRLVLSLLGCISAGVFLGAGFMHMTAEALESIENKIQKFMIQNRTESEGKASDSTDSARVEYPYGELIISLGFFFVFLLESLALQCWPGAAGAFTATQEELVFEGLAVGLQTTVTATVQLCLAVLAHKGVVVFSVGLRLMQRITFSKLFVISRTFKLTPQGS